MQEFPWLPLLLAPFAGSFVGVLVRRLPAGRPILLARSACEACGAPLRPRDLVPLLSFAALGGRCRRCRAPIDPCHWQVELAAAGVAAWAGLADPARVWPDCALGWTLLALGWIDRDCFRLPDALTLPLIPAGLWLAGPDATDHALAAAIGYAAFRVVALGYRWVRGRDGLGEGDAKLLAALGAWVGVEGLAPAVLGAAWVGLGAAALMWARGRTVSGTTAIPFGPCLALAGWIVRLHW